MDGLPSLTISNYFNLGSRMFTPNDKKTTVWQLNDTFSWTRGAHTFKFGGELRLEGSWAHSGNITRGAMTFNGQFTSRVPGTGVGDPFADFLLGLTSAASLSTFQDAQQLDRTTARSWKTCGA